MGWFYLCSKTERRPASDMGMRSRNTDARPEVLAVPKGGIVVETPPDFRAVAHVYENGCDVSDEKPIQGFGDLKRPTRT
jgi:predicted phosphoribosyltransferase